MIRAAAQFRIFANIRTEGAKSEKFSGHCLSVASDQTQVQNRFVEGSLGEDQRNALLVFRSAGHFRTYAWNRHGPALSISSAYQQAGIG